MNGIANMADVLDVESKAPSLPSSTYELIADSARRHPDAPALSFFLRTVDHARPQRWTYSELHGQITATANLFHSQGVGPEDVVAYILPNLPETHFTIWGAQAAGIAFAINPLLEPSAISELLRAGKTKVLVTLAPFPGTDVWQRVQSILSEVPTLRHVVLVNLADHVRGPMGWAASWLQRRQERRLHGRLGARAAIPAGVQLHGFRAAVARQLSERLRSGRRIHSGDVSSYFCTGGTTGTPKIAVRTHGNEVSNAWSAGQFLGDGINASKTIFCGLPLFHVNGALVTGLLPFWRGAHVVLGTPQGYRGEGVIPRFWEIVETHQINFFSGVPTLYAALMQHGTRGRELGSLEYALCGAAPMPVELIREFEERTGVKILEGYGLTEGTCVSTCNPPMGERRPGSIGLRVPLQEMKAAVLDESGVYVRDCADGEAGVLLVCGPNVFRGYLLHEQNAGLWATTDNGQAWLNTGDLGYRDAQGYFYLTGRKKELIIRGGHNIDPAAIEEPLYAHPAVKLAAAVGRPDAHAGEVPVAYVELREGASVSEAALLAHARETIAERAAIPKAVRIVPVMPVTPVGKIFKPELKRQETAAALADALSEAGLPGQQLQIHVDAQRGICVALVGFSPSELDRAKQVLGRYPFPIVELQPLQC